MPHLIAWCGFLGAWLLVAGPLDQALRELDDEEFERDSLARAAKDVEQPPQVSHWWMLLPPAYYVLRRRRDGEYRQRIVAAMPREDLEAFLHLRDVASAWAYVAAGASLIAVKETWELHEAYEWPQWAFWALAAGTLLACGAFTTARARRRHQDVA
jgi:hypothetical protein